MLIVTILLSIIVVILLVRLSILSEKLRSTEINKKLRVLKFDFKRIVKNQDLIKINSDKVQFYAVMGDQNKFLINLNLSQSLQSSSDKLSIESFIMYIQYMLKQESWDERIEITF